MKSAQYTKVLIYTPEITTRVRYAVDFIFKTILKAEPILTTNKDEFIHFSSSKINYSNENLGSGLFINAHPLLFEETISNQMIEIVEYKDIQLFFPTSEDSILPFDPLACTFYLLARYEEYDSEQIDEHGRFSDAENILVRNNCYQKPVVDLMAFWLAEKISAHFPDFNAGKRTFSFFTTIDVDNAWAFKNKSVLVSLGATAKAFFHRDWVELKQRLSVILRLRKDPYDTYKYILETYKSHLSHILFFFLIGDRNNYDRNISHKNRNFRQLIINLSSVCEIGIHPSYASNQKLWLFNTEKERLENILRKPITQSRQHFLKLRFPNTYQNLVKCGITHDFTMGFASLCGFRAGTCTPFPFFDLSNNQITELIVHPFQFMDVSLNNYLKLDPEEAWTLIEKLMNEVKNVNGTFVSLWHNESLKETGQWTGWSEIFEKVQSTGIKFENE